MVVKKGIKAINSIARIIIFDLMAMNVYREEIKPFLPEVKLFIEEIEKLIKNPSLLFPMKNNATKPKIYKMNIKTARLALGDIMPMAIGTDSYIRKTFVL